MDARHTASGGGKQPDPLQFGVFGLGASGLEFQGSTLHALGVVVCLCFRVRVLRFRTLRLDRVVKNPRHIPNGPPGPFC